MSEKRETMPVFFTIDESFTPYLDTALISLTENASDKYDYRIVVINDNISEKSRKILSSHEKENVRVEFAEMGDEISSITNRVENKLRCDYFTMTIYFRLFIPEMFPQYDKGIYIDSDIIVAGDISEMYHIDIGDSIVGACPDLSIADVPDFAKYIEEAVGINRYRYVNSGVLLMNLSKMRELKFSEEFLRLMNKYHFDSIAPDQDYLNAMCCGKIHFLDEKWDAMPNRQKLPQASPKLIHYNLFDKPWCYDGIQYEEYFWKYAKRSAYYEEILNFKRNYSEQDKASDAKCLNEMLTKAARLAGEDKTFRKMYERGEKIRV
ncbi:MAG: glycosyltransferase family 8 protein [Clostridiales bacterium]|nr:glycosyltransferase family 8 protein [Clostridiales bacterium]